MIEYRVKRVERFIVTRFEEDEAGSAVFEVGGLFPSYHAAYEVGYALAKQDQLRLATSPEDEFVLLQGEAIGKAATASIGIVPNP